jgi:hypothetical protein
MLCSCARTGTPTICAHPVENGGLRGAEGKSGDGQTLGTGVVLGEPGFFLGERGRRDRFGARRGESLFSRRSNQAKELKQAFVIVVKATAWQDGEKP